MFLRRITKCFIPHKRKVFYLEPAMAKFGDSRFAGLNATGKTIPNAVFGHCSGL
jgi:hypothetical protein